MSSAKHGGKRLGAGRKANPLGQTTTLRVPKSQVIEIRHYLNSVAQDTTATAVSNIASTRTTSTQPKILQKASCCDVASITALQATTHMQIILASEKISAGFPSPAQDHIEKKLDMNEHLIRNEESTFLVVASSRSMLYAGIDQGDELLVDRSLEARHFDVVVALIENDFTVKRLMIEGDKRWLKAENPEYPNIYLKDAQELVIWGVVTRVIKKFR